MINTRKLIAEEIKKKESEARMYNASIKSCAKGIKRREKDMHDYAKKISELTVIINQLKKGE